MKQAEAGIVEITMHTPTIHGAALRPRPVNFFFGKNGTGKTSIGRAIADPANETVWAEESQKGAKIYVYNEQFIENNVHCYDSLPAIYAFSEENVGIRRQIDEKMEEKAASEKHIQEMLVSLEQMKTEAAQTENGYIKSIWRGAAGYRKRYEKAVQSHNENIEDFASYLAGFRRVEDKKENLDASYEIAFGQEPVHYTTYVLLPRDSFPADDLLDIPIVSRGDSFLSVLYQTLGSLDWARVGHDAYQHSAGCRCPYCGQNLPDDFEVKFSACLDTQYRQKMEELKSFLSAYQEAADKITEMLETNLREAYQDEPQYRVLAELLAEKINGNIQTIQQKINNPGMELFLSDMAGLVEKINAAANEANQRRMRYIEAGENISHARERCVTQIWQAMAAKNEDLLDQWETSKKENAKKIRSQELQIQTAEGKLQRLNQEIEALNRSMADISRAMAEINATLKTSGFVGFHFQEKNHQAYELVREGQPEKGAAIGLSEGERRFVAFLYFFHMVMGTFAADGQAEKKVIVIDDPVCSLDSEVLAFVAALVRSIIQRCLDRFRCGTQESHILQVFCLTHNPVFFRLVSDSFIPDHVHCAYYEVRKSKQNVTDIMPCVAKADMIGTELINRSPVSDEYQGLWRQYALTEDPQALMNVSRQILCHYFLLTCHHDSRELQRILLDEHKDAFTPPGSNDWQTSFNIVSAMLSLMNLNCSGALDSLYFDMSAVDPDQIRFVFKKIFEVMRQEQHYKHMIGTVEK